MSSPAEFDYFVVHGESDAVFRLTDDLDFSNYTFSEEYYERLLSGYDQSSFKPIEGQEQYVFSGVLDGGIYDEYGNLTGSHKIENLTIKSTGKAQQYGLFYRAYGLSGEDPVTFKNLEFVNCSLDNTSSKGAGLLAFGHDSSDGLGEDGHPADSGICLENITVSNCNMEVGRNGGMLIGYARSTNFCAYDITIDAASSISGSDIGGILGTNNNNDTPGFDLVDGSGWENRPFDMVFENCHVSATIRGSEPGALLGNSFYKRVGLDPDKCQKPENQKMEYHETGVTTITDCIFDGTLSVSSTDAAFIEHIQKCPWIGFYGDRNQGEIPRDYHYDCSAPDLTNSSFEDATIDVPKQP